MNIREHLPLQEAPDSIWEGIEAGLARRQTRPRVALWWIGVAAAVACLAVMGIYRVAIRGEVESGAGPTTLRIGSIGSIELSPHTQLRVMADRADQHRLRLVRGEIYAQITAPPRIFLVETKAGTAVDLGCEYRLKMNEDGSGMLRVTKGWVSFEGKGVDSLVPAGAWCRIVAGLGPEIPYFEDASPEFIRGDLDMKLSLARVRDTLTLWHLLVRAGFADRGRIYDRIAGLVPMPKEVLKERAVALDPEVLNQMKEELAWKW